MSVEAILNLFPEVTWDRFTGDLCTLFGMGVFGWMSRLDGQRDFVYIRVNDLGTWHIATSSAKYSKDFSQRLGFTDHTDCKRVADHFPNTRTV